MEAERIASELISTGRLRLECCHRLADTAEAQQTILLQGRHSELPESIARFDSLLLEISNAEKREESLLLRLQEEHAEAERGIPSAVKSALSAISNDTRRCVERLHALCRENRQLLDNAMQFVDFSIGIICRAAAGCSPNSPDAYGSGPALLLDTKV